MTGLDGVEASVGGAGPSPEPPARQRPLGRGYRRLLEASAVSNLGDGIYATALPMLAATLTRDPVLFAGVAAATRLPWLLFALYAGVLVDRWDRRRLIIVVNTVRFALLALLGAAVVGGRATIWLVYAVSFGLGLGETLVDTAARALVPSLVGRDQLERANSRLYGVEVVTLQLAGPPLGGWLFMVAAALPVLLDAGTFLVAAAFVLAISGSFTARRVEPAARRMHGEIVEGLRWLWRIPSLRAIALLEALLSGLGAANLAVFPLFAMEILGLGPSGYGLLVMCVGVGSVLVTPLVGRIIERFGRVRPMFVALAGFVVATVVQGSSSSGVVVGAMAALFGACMVIWNVITVSRLQAAAPDGLLGRVTSVVSFLSWGSMALGALLGGLLAGALSLRAPFMVAACVWTLAGLVVAPALRTLGAPAPRAGR